MQLLYTMTNKLLKRFLNIHVSSNDRYSVMKMNQSINQTTLINWLIPLTDFPGMTAVADNVIIFIP